MINLVLVEPEIPPNTGNIIRLCANTGAHLHLIKPLGFNLTEKSFRRAGLDYHQKMQVTLYENYEDYRERNKGQRLLACETIGETLYSQMHFQPQDAILFGSETKGLSKKILRLLPPQHIFKLPMHTQDRSLNLSNTVAIVLYEAWRQWDFMHL